MLSSNTGIFTGYLMGRFPGKVGNLFSPGDQRGPFEYADYALDNGAFGQGDDWSESKWIKLMEWARLSGHDPLWALVPDVVGDREGTLARWERYFPVAREYGWPLAFAVQDGMTAGDVPVEAQVVFVGGSTKWKWLTYRDWCSGFPRVHIGRVNTYKLLYRCHDAGAESTDGTGWTRGNQKQRRGLVAYLEQSTGVRKRPTQEHLFGGENAVRVPGILN